MEVMDALELPYHPVEVAATKLLGSAEGFVRQNDAVSVLASPTIERCSSLLSHKGNSNKFYFILLLFYYFIFYKFKIFVVISVVLLIYSEN